MQGERIKCKLVDGTKIIGHLTELTDSSFQLDGKGILIEDVQCLAKKKRGTGLYMGLVIGAGVALILTGNITSQSQLYLMGSAQSLLLIKPINNSLWRDVKNKWELEVIDQSHFFLSH